jgi:hypothetical protein
MPTSLPNISNYYRPRVTNEGYGESIGLGKWKKWGNFESACEARPQVPELTPPIIDFCRFWNITCLSDGINTKLGKQDGISRYAQQWTEATISIYLGEPISAAFHNCKDVSPPSSLAISLRRVHPPTAHTPIPPKPKFNFNINLLIINIILYFVKF